MKWGPDPTTVTTQKRRYVLIATIISFLGMGGILWVSRIWDNWNIWIVSTVVVFFAAGIWKVAQYYRV